MPLTLEYNLMECTNLKLFDLKTQSKQSAFLMEVYTSESKCLVYSNQQIWNK